MADLSTFNKSNGFEILPKEVVSDHASIGIQFDEHINILANNISNPEYHKYFSTNKSFTKTHMNTNKNDSDVTKKKWLEDKTAKQIVDIIDNIKSGKWDVQIIVEAYDDFIKKISSGLNDYKHQIVSILDLEPDKYLNQPKNITAILIKESEKLRIVQTFIRVVTYTDDDQIQSKTFNVPICYLKNNITNMAFIILAIHLPGNDQQFPEMAATELKKIMTELHEKTPDHAIIAMGDYNTIPANLQKIFLNSPFMVYNPLYATHINPNCEISVYDNIVYWIPSKNQEIGTQTGQTLSAERQVDLPLKGQGQIKQHPLSSMDIHTIEYVNALNKLFNESQ